jgi:hypothetical protein
MAEKIRRRRFGAKDKADQEAGKDREQIGSSERRLASHLGCWGFRSNVHAAQFALSAGHIAATTFTRPLSRQVCRGAVARKTEDPAPDSHLVFFRKAGNEVEIVRVPHE